MKTSLTRTKTRETSISTKPEKQTPSDARVESILVPTDFSTASLKGVSYAKKLAQQCGARVSLLYVIEPVVLPDAAAIIALPDDQLIARMRKRLSDLARGYEEKGFSFDRMLVRQGTPFHEIALAAVAAKSDIIVIATHGYTGLKHVLLGSTAERVVRHARCPVLVVPARD
jgi:nucleotide-binding universal stress UspA family protein